MGTIFFFSAVFIAAYFYALPCGARPTETKRFLFRKQCENECSGPGQKCRQIDNGAYKWECLGGSVQTKEKIQYRRRKLHEGCSDCDPEKRFICPSDKRKWIRDKKVPNPFPNRSLLTVPNGFVVKKSSIPNAGLGVWTLKNISECVIIGPYGGERVYNKDDSTLVYAWEIEDENKDMRYLVDAADPRKSNWLRYINSAVTEDSVNLDAVQYKGEMYYQVTGAIPAVRSKVMKLEVRTDTRASI